MSETGSSERDWEAVDDETLAELEAEQAKYAAELEELRLAECHAAGESSGGHAYGSISARGSGPEQTVDLSAENARLRAELEAVTSMSASATRRDADDVKAKLAKVSAENAKLTAALEMGVGLSELTAVRSSASVLAASRARMLAMVKSNLSLGCDLPMTDHFTQVCRIKALLTLLSRHQTCTPCCKSWRHVRKVLTYAS